MSDLKKAGKIRQFGASNETAWGLMHYIRTAEKLNLPKPVTIQNPYSLLNRTYEIGLSEVSYREDVPLLAYSPLGYGLLTGKYHNDSDVSEARLKLFPQLARYNGERSYATAEKYVALAHNFGLKPGQMALSFIHSQPYVATCIIGVTKMSQLRENIESIDTVLPKELLETMNEIHHESPNPAP